jgi:hypothetical protein
MMQARIRAPTYSRLRVSSATDSTPSGASRCDSSSGRAGADDGNLGSHDHFSPEAWLGARRVTATRACSSATLAPKVSVTTAPSRLIMMVA